MMPARYWMTLPFRPGRLALQPIMPLSGGRPLYHELLYRPQWPWRTMPAPDGDGFRWWCWYHYLLSGVLKKLMNEVGALAINLNTYQAADHRLFKALLNILGQNLPGPLWIEWTEYEASQEKVFQAAENLCRLREAGAHITIDDAGSGMDWESRARLVSPQIVKLDGAFFHRAMRKINGSDWQTAFRIVCLARERYQAPTTAEWIEHPDHLDVAARLGCTFGQGFYFRRGSK